MILVIVATVLLAFDFALQKKYQRSESATLAAGLKFNAVSGLLKAIIFFVLSGFTLEFSVFSITLALLMAVANIAYVLIGFQILKHASMALYSLFLMCGGMLLPYFYGVLFLNEEVNAFRMVGVLIILIAILLSNKTKQGVNVTVILCCIAVFLLNGCVSIISKAHQISEAFAPVNSAAFVMYSGLFKGLVSLLVLPFVKSQKQATIFSSKTTLLVIGASALIGGVSYMFQLIGAKELPATVLYPLVTGGSIIFSTLSGIVFFKEKLSVYQAISIVLCFAGTILFL